MRIRFAWTGLTAARLFRRSHEAETLWGTVFPLPSRRTLPRRTPDGIASCVVFSDRVGWLLQLRGRTGRNRELRGLSRTESRAAWVVFPRKGDSRLAHPRKGDSRPATAEKTTQKRFPSGPRRRLEAVCWGRLSRRGRLMGFVFAWGLIGDSQSKIPNKNLLFTAISYKTGLLL